MPQLFWNVITVYSKDILINGEDNLYRIVFVEASEQLIYKLEETGQRVMPTAKNRGTIGMTED